MKIANVMLGRGLGGIEQAVVDYSEAITLAGHKAHAIVHPQAEIIPFLIQCNLPFSTLPNLGAWDMVAAAKLRTLLDAAETEICIAHGNRALSLLRRTAGNRRLVAVSHNYKVKYGNVKNVFCPTQDLIRHTCSHGGNRNIQLVPNMVRMKHDLKPRVRQQPPVIGSMGRFVAKKGFDVYIEALTMLRKAGIPFRAVLGGSGEEEKTLRALAQKHGLDDVLSFSGWVSDKQAFFNSIDIFCLPSQHEPFGIVLLEAMAQGLPVISTASEGPSEIIDNGVNGLLVAKADAVKLATGLQQLLSEPLKAENMGKNAFETVYNHYDISVVSVKLDLALKSIH